jgi:integrase
VRDASLTPRQIRARSARWETAGGVVERDRRQVPSKHLPEAIANNDASLGMRHHEHMAAQDLLLVRLAADSGARRGELVALRFDDFDGRVLRIARAMSDGVITTPKSGHGRQLTLAASTATTRPAEKRPVNRSFASALRTSTDSDRARENSEAHGDGSSGCEECDASSQANEEKVDHVRDQRRNKPVSEFVPRYERVDKR